MAKPQTAFLLCETICEAVRNRLPDSFASDSTFFFDYEGLTPVVTVDIAVVQTVVDRLLRFSFRTFGPDGVFFRVTVSALSVNECAVLIRVATASSQVPPTTALKREEPVPEEDADLNLVHAVCSRLGGRSLRLSDENGTVLESLFIASVLSPSFEDAAISAEGAAAWLVGTPRITLKMLSRRLQRVGWQVRVFESMGELEAGLGQPGTQPPALVIGSLHRGVDLASMQRVRERLPAGSKTVVQTLQRNAFDTEPPEGVEVLAIPLSPRRLMHYTEVARQGGLRPSGHTRAGTLEPSGRGLVLIVDDNAVNRILAEEIVQMLGYRTHSVDSGEAALTECSKRAPNLVLMDLYMPGMGGAEANRQIKTRQGAGALPAFAVVAVSAAPASEIRAHDFDDFVPKPISIQQMRSVLLQWMPQMAPLR